MQNPHPLIVEIPHPIHLYVLITGGTEWRNTRCIRQQQNWVDHEPGVPVGYHPTNSWNHDIQPGEKKTKNTPPIREHTKQFKHESPLPHKEATRGTHSEDSCVRRDRWRPKTHGQECELSQRDGPNLC